MSPNNGASRTYYRIKIVFVEKKDKIWQVTEPRDFFCIFGLPVSQNVKKRVSRKKNRDFSKPKIFRFI